MNEIRVWAPRPHTVTLKADGSNIAMSRDPLGWWSTRAPADLADYAFCVDGGQPLPDPRSAWQPSGVHGPSRLVEHSRFGWTDSGWKAPPLTEAIFYELHIGTFTEQGTFDAAIEKIPHLRALGITHVEIMPVAEFSGNWGWGYDGVDLYAPHEAYGGPEALKRFVNALHANGLAAVLDVVYNHLGPSGNYLSQFGPYFSDRMRTPWGEAINFCEPGSDAVREFFISNALMWLRDYHFDGLRLDAVHAITDLSALHILEELCDRIKDLEQELRRPLFAVAESDQNDPRLLRAPQSGGYGLSAQWNDDFHHALHTLLTGEASGYYSDFGSLWHLAKAIAVGFVYDGQYSAFRNRRHGRALDPSLRNRLVAFLQNHDQIGNRAQGDRIHMLAGVERAKMGAALVLLGPFIPLLFQGEEWAASSPFQYFTNHSEPELARAVSEGRRREFAAFGWPPDQVPDPQDAQTFHRSRLKWSELADEPHRSMFDWYRKLIQFRREHAELTSAEASATFDETDRTFVMHRPGVDVICNFGAQDARVAQPEARQIVLASANFLWEAGELVVARDSVIVVSRTVPFGVHGSAADREPAVAEF